MERRILLDQVKRQSAEFARTRHLHLASTAAEIMTRAFGAADEVEQASVEATVALMVEYGRVIHLDSQILADAETAKAAYGLSMKDALVYASILSDLSRNPGDGDDVFISRDAGVFGSVDIRRELSGAGCRYITRVRDGRD